jgi:hypothetical protein
MKRLTTTRLVMALAAAVAQPADAVDAVSNDAPAASRPFQFTL